MLSWRQYKSGHLYRGQHHEGHLRSKGHHEGRVVGGRVPRRHRRQRRAPHVDRRDARQQPLHGLLPLNSRLVCKVQWRSVGCAGKGARAGCGGDQQLAAVGLQRGGTPQVPASPAPQPEQGQRRTARLVRWRWCRTACTPLPAMVHRLL